MYDLHCHSTASDGRLSPGELVALAAENGVTTLALTDHDTVDGLAPAASAAAVYGIALVAGVEISVSWRRRTLHIVGLAFDPADPFLAAGLAGLQAERGRRAARMAEKLEKIGLADALARAQAMAGDGHIARPHFARLLVADGLCPDTNQAFRRYLKPGRPGHVCAEWVELEAAIGWIRGADGIAVLAHPFGYRFSGAWRRRAVAAFAEAGGQALEICTGSSDPAQESTAAEDARRHGLLASVGSDFHAREQAWLRLGRLRRPAADLRTVWQDSKFGPLHG
ncbi:MAG: PHP domain-containing protein [Salinisphaera sp.]|jgi:predicted metal-dependent phosphoesterase TrpH|nr:PHP domain-containing protein [Salinisphaera sp.]